MKYKLKNGMFIGVSHSGALGRYAEMDDMTITGAGVFESVMGYQRDCNRSKCKRQVQPFYSVARTLRHPQPTPSLLVARPPCALSSSGIRLMHFCIQRLNAGVQGGLEKSRMRSQSRYQGATGDCIKRLFRK